MTKVRVHAFSLSLDGYGAGPNQDLGNPLGVGGLALHEWVFPTRSFYRMQGYKCTEHITTAQATHFVLTQRGFDDKT